MLIIPCALCIAALAWPVLTVIFQGGRFGPEETLAALPLTRLMLTATPFWLIYAILVRGYYAQGDTLTPAVSGTAMTLLCLPLYRYWAVPHGGLGHSRAFPASASASMCCCSWASGRAVKDATPSAGFWA